MCWVCFIQKLYGWSKGVLFLLGVVISFVLIDSF
jgi:hypothetical protein